MQEALILLQELTAADVQWVFTAGVEECIAPGTTLIREGETTEAIFIVFMGAFQVRTRAGGERVVATVGANEIVGEMSFLERRPHSATLIANEDTWVVRLPWGVLEAKLCSDTAFAARFYRSLAVLASRRLRETTQMLGAYGSP